MWPGLPGNSLNGAKQINPRFSSVLPCLLLEQPAVFGRDQVLRFAPQFGFPFDARPVRSQDEASSLVADLADSNDVYGLSKFQERLRFTLTDYLVD